MANWYLLPPLFRSGFRPSCVSERSTFAPEARATLGQKQFLTTNPALAKWSNQLMASQLITGLGAWFVQKLRISAHHDRPFRYIVTDHFANA